MAAKTIGKKRGETFNLENLATYMFLTATLNSSGFSLARGRGYQYPPGNDILLVAKGAKEKVGRAYSPPGFPGTGAYKIVTADTRLKKDMDVLIFQDPLPSFKLALGKAIFEKLKKEGYSFSGKGQWIAVYKKAAKATYYTAAGKAFKPDVLVGTVENVGGRYYIRVLDQKFEKDTLAALKMLTKPRKTAGTPAVTTR